MTYNYHDSMNIGGFLLGDNESGLYPDANRTATSIVTTTTTGGSLPQYGQLQPGYVLTAPGLSFMGYLQQIQDRSDAVRQLAANDSLKSLKAIRPTKLKKKRVATPVATPVSDPGVDAEYMALADKLGIASAPINKAKFESLLAAESMGCYDPQKVDLYMRQLAEKVHKYWCWKPLRKLDRDLMGSIKTNAWGQSHGMHVNTIYEHAVPYPVLLTVQKIIDSAQEQVLFFVSSYEDPRPDPFLSCSTVDLFPELWIIERWNEPAWR